MSGTLSFEDILKRDKILVYKTKGISMLPMLRPDRDLVMIREKNGRLKRLDTALYKRSDGQYVLHRVIEVTEDGYIMRGDNCCYNENVPESRVIGVLDGFKRNGKSISVESRTYLLYAHFWNTIYPMRKLYALVRRALGALKRKFLRGFKHE